MKWNKALITTAMVFGMIGSATIPALAESTGSSAPPAASGAIPTDGTGTVIENSADTPEKREFFTIKTPAGNVFYIVVDKQKTGENVYLLTPVTEADLAALAGSKTAKNIAGGSTVSWPEPDSAVSEAPPASSQPAVSQAPGTSPENKAEKTAQARQQPGQSNDTGTVVLVVLAVLIAGGAGFYFKIYRPRHEMGGTEDDAEEPEEKSPDADEGTPDEEEDGKDDDSDDEDGEE